MIQYIQIKPKMFIKNLESTRHKAQRDRRPKHITEAQYSSGVQSTH